MPKVSETHAEERRRQILLAACICMSHKGFHRMSMKDICRQAGLSAGAVYTYFKGKEEILQALAEDGLQNFEILLKELEGAGGVRAAIHTFFEIMETSLRHTHELVPGLDANRVKVALWVEVMRDPKILATFDGQYQQFLRRFGRMVRAGQRSGEVRRGVDPKAVTQVVTSLLEGLTLQRAIHPDMNVKKYLQAMFALVDGDLWLDGEAKQEEKE